MVLVMLVRLYLSDRLALSELVVRKKHVHATVVSQVRVDNVLCLSVVVPINRCPAA